MFFFTAEGLDKVEKQNFTDRYGSVCISVVIAWSMWKRTVLHFLPWVCISRLMPFSLLKEIYSLQVYMTPRKQCFGHPHKPLNSFTFLFKLLGLITKWVTIPETTQNPWMEAAWKLEIIMDQGSSQGFAMSVAPNTQFNAPSSAVNVE